MIVSCRSSDKDEVLLVDPFGIVPNSVFGTLILSLSYSTDSCRLRSALNLYHACFAIRLSHSQILEAGR